MSATDPILAPGTVDFDPFSDVFFNNPFNTYCRLRDEAPVYPTRSMRRSNITAPQANSSQCRVVNGVRRGDDRSMSGYIADTVRRFDGEDDRWQSDPSARALQLIPPLCPHG